MGAFPFLLSLLLPVLLTFLFLPATLRFLAGLLGSYLRRSTQTRRDLLLERVAKEQQHYEANHEKHGRQEDDWEEIEGSMVGSAVNGGKADKDWRGIVGFFHPFW